MIEIVCPSCRNAVWPERRKLPGIPDGRGLVSVAEISFGNFCPSPGCGFRLSDNLEDHDKPSEVEQANEDSAPIDLPKSLTTKKVIPIRKPPSEDLFDRIPREYEDAVREEREATERLRTATDRREKLERLMTAIGLSTAIAAE